MNDVLLLPIETFLLDFDSLISSFFNLVRRFFPDIFVENAEKMALAYRVRTKYNDLPSMDILEVMSRALAENHLTRFYSDAAEISDDRVFKIFNPSSPLWLFRSSRYYIRTNNDKTAMLQLLLDLMIGFARLYKVYRLFKPRIENMRREDRAQSSAYNPRQISDDDVDVSQDLLTSGSEGDLSYDEDGFAKDDEERKPRTTLARVSAEDLEELIATFNPDARMLMNVYYEATAGMPTDEESIKVLDIFSNGMRMSRFAAGTIEITKGSKVTHLPVKPFVDHHIFFERGDKFVVDTFQWVHVDASSCQIREGKRFTEAYILKAASRLRCAPPLTREPFYMAPSENSAFTVFCMESVSRFNVTVDAIPEVLNLLERLKKATIIHHDTVVRNIVRIRGTLYLVNYDHAWYGGYDYAGSPEQRPPARIPYHWDLEAKKKNRD